MHSQFGDWLKIHSDKKWFQRMRTSLTDELETRMNKYDGMKNNHKSSLLHASLLQLLLSIVLAFWRKEFQYMPNI